MAARNTGKVNNIFHPFYKGSALGAIPIRWHLVASAGLVVTVYVLANVVKLYGLSAYFIPPILWLLVFALLFRFEWRVSSYTSRAVALIPLLIVVRIVGEYGLGLLLGFGRNAVTLTPLSMAMSLLRFVPMAMGIEMLRVGLVNMARRRGAIVLITVALTFLTVPLGRILASLSDMESLLNFASNTFIPRVIENAFLCVLAAIGGAKPLLQYALAWTLFMNTSPLLATGNQYVLSLGHSVILLLQLALLEYGIGMHDSGHEQGYRLGKVLGSVLVMMFAIGIAVSMFMGVRFMTVISGSMRPAIDVGDLVVVAPVNRYNVSVGEVIAFVRGGITVLHRVVGTTRVRGQLAYVTKGDANNAPDREPVLPQQIVGRLVYVVPHVGYPLVYIAQYQRGYVDAVVTAILFIVLVYYILLIRIE